MKTRNVLIAIVLIVAGSLTMKPLAQENIKAMIKKCESMDVIDANIVRNKPITNYTTTTTRSGDTASVRRTLFPMAPRSIVNITLKYTPALEKELVAAFRKDQDKANHEVEQIKGGKVSHMLYRFDDAEYSFTIKNDTITINATEGQNMLGSASSNISFSVPISASRRISYNDLDSIQRRIELLRKNMEKMPSVDSFRINLDYLLQNKLIEEK